PAYLPFVHELARHAALGAPPRVAIAGEPLVEFLPARMGGLDADVSTPDGRTLSISVAEQDEVAVARIPDTDQSGIYRMTVGSNRHEYLFAVNVPSTTSAALGSESDLRRIDPDDLQAGMAENDIQVVTDLSQIRRKAKAASVPDDSETAPRSSAAPAVARGLLLLFFALLLLETVLAWLFGAARTVVPPDATAAPAPRPLLVRIFDPRNVAFLPLVVAALVGLVLFHETLTDEFLGFLPSTWRAGLERSLGVPAAAPGEGTRWKLEYLSYLTGFA